MNKPFARVASGSLRDEPGWRSWLPLSFGNRGKEGAKCANSAFEAYACMGVGFSSKSEVQIEQAVSKEGRALQA